MLEQFSNYVNSNSIQDIYNFICNHLEKQGCRSKHDENNPLYRNGNHSCAIGCLITDDEYLKGIEGLPVEQIFIDCDVKISKKKQKFLSHMQEVHDLSYNLEVLQRKMNEVADDYSLTPFTFSPDLNWD